MTVKICGISYEVIECDDNFDKSLVQFGEIDFKKGIIRINKDLSQEQKSETLWHEIFHGILVHLGYNDRSDDEQFVQAIANAIYQSYKDLSEEK